MSLNFFFVLIVMFCSPIFSEKIVTTKEDEPDAYYGLKLNLIATPTFGYRLRDSANGTSNAGLNDRTGFSMPWTLLMLSKDWEDKNLSLEVWGELTRNSTLSSDTQVNGGSKANPYLMQIRRANIQKTWKLSQLSLKFIFGIQELPHVYTQWKELWNWRYIDKAPMESMSFAPQPADIGISTLLAYAIFQFYLGVMNGEGYREIQNSDSSAVDLYSRVSIEKKLENFFLGLHLLGRLGNFFGQAGNECIEGKTKCIASDSNSNTFLIKDLRSLKTETLGMEINFIWKEIFNLGLGGFYKKKHGGITFDRFNLSKLPEYEADLIGKGTYFWTTISYQNFTIGYRKEFGDGNNGIVGVYNSKSDGIYHYLDPNSYYRSKERFVRELGFMEYLYDSSIRFALGYAEVKNFDKNGEPKKVYIQNLSGNETTQSEYLNQFKNSNPTINPYLDRKERQLFFKAMLSF